MTSWPEISRTVERRAAGRCEYCRMHQSLQGATFHVEHIIPRSRGGKSEIENLAWACPGCNRYKSDRTFGAGNEQTRMIALFHPHLDAWNDHFSWSEDATELIGLTPSGKVTIDTLRMNRPQLIRVRRLWVAMGEHPPDLR